MAVIVSREPFDARVSPIHPAASRLLAPRRFHPRADRASDVDAGPRPWSGLPVSDAVGPWSLCPHGGGPPLGIVACRAPPTGAEGLVRQWPRRAPHLHRVAGTARGAVGTAPATAGGLACPPRGGSWRGRWGTAQSGAWSGHAPPHLPTMATSVACALAPHTDGAGRGRLGLLETPDGWNTPH